MWSTPGKKEARNLHLHDKWRCALLPRAVSINVLAIACITSLVAPGNALGGADVIVSDLSGILNYGTLDTCTNSGLTCTTDADCNACSTSGGPCSIDADCPGSETCVITGNTCDREVTAFSIGTWSCNVGDVPLLWCDLSHNPANCDINEHPAIVGNMYRLKNNRFEQLGMSWVKHGFAGVDSGGCGTTCEPTGTDDLLGVGCRDLYSPQLNANQPALGPRSEINPSTGQFPYPFNLAWQQSGDNIYKRIQVETVDLMPDLNPDTLYFIEGQYITPDDSAAGNGGNNVSYHEVTVTGPNEQNNYLASLSGTTIAQQPAIRAWKAHNANVIEADIDVPGDGTLILAGDAVDLGDGFHRYEYALYNMNSDRSAGSLFVPLPLGAIVRNVEFHDVAYHSGEPFNNEPWEHEISGPGIEFYTESFDNNANANAVRWGTLYNFSFEVNSPPANDGDVTVGLFKTGIPADMIATMLAPELTEVDCNDNGIADSEDLAQGTSDDCDENLVPDECQTDCNTNLIPDVCDLLDGTSDDCNENSIPDECDIDCNENGTPDECEAFDDCDGNLVPDECDPDCDESGIPDACEDDPDTDEDGIPDCEDACRLTSPEGACVCPPKVCCETPPFPPCSLIVDWEFCLEIGGIPDCIPSDNCRDGCLIGDWNESGDLDYGDVAGIQQCFTGPFDTPSFETPSDACLRFFDDDQDGDIDLDDYLEWHLGANP